VAIFVASDLAKFVYALREREERDSVRPWLQGHTDAARMIWEHRLSLAAHCRTRCRADRAIRGWVDSLPAGALVYDVRVPELIRGWPYGIAAEHGYLSRCGKLPVFAVASPIEVRAAARDQYHARAALEYATPGASF
jgi:hypothetical protein